MTDDIIEIEPEHRVVNIAGRWMRDVSLTVKPEMLDRMRQGYMCARCQEPLREPWPEVCPLVGCGYEIGRHQKADLERDYMGEDTNLWQDYETEPVESRARKSGIWVPKGVN